MIRHREPGGGKMTRILRTVERWGDTGRLRREDIRAVVIALRDGKPLPEVRPIEGERRTERTTHRG